MYVSLRRKYEFCLGLMGAEVTRLFNDGAMSQRIPVVNIDLFNCGMWIY